MKALIIIAPENFRDEEYDVPREALEDAGVKVTTASTTDEECTGMLGMNVTPNKLVSDVNASDYDAVIVAGGGGSKEYLWDDPDVLEVVAEAAEAGKIVAGICLSGAVLANAGVLKGRKATVFKTVETLDALAEGGAKYVKEDVVVDGNIITAEGPNVVDEFAAKILEALGA